MDTRMPHPAQRILFSICALSLVANVSLLYAVVQVKRENDELNRTIDEVDRAIESELEALKEEVNIARKRADDPEHIEKVRALKKRLKEGMRKAERRHRTEIRAGG